jgi:hypothetical protein
VDRDGPLRNMGLVVAGVPLTFLVDHSAVPVLTIGREMSVAFFDTTSLYFEGAGGETLGQRGHSKDYRFC